MGNDLAGMARPCPAPPPHKRNITMLNSLKHKHKHALAILTALTGAAFASAVSQFLFAGDAAKTAGEQNVIRPLSCRVVGIADGDTLTCLTDAKQQLKVRLHAIDAPEKQQAFGQQAKKHLSDLVYNQTVTLHITDTDRYGRIVADIQLLGSLNVNQQMVKDGYAWAYRRYGGTRYAQEEKAARKAKLGLWRDANPIEPSQWRRMNK